jgi:2-alkyl-3-oxoalkanoate reductase
MKVLVTGGTGFLGRYVVRRLLKAGDFVRVLVRPVRTQVGGKRNTANSGAEEVAGDMRDAASLERAVDGMEAICHCAAVMQTARPWSDFEEITVRGTERLLAAALCQRVDRFLHVSSLGIYGHQHQQTITEESPFDEGEEGRGHYTRSKIEAERVVWKYYREHNLPVTVVRPGVLYGPGKPPFVARVCLSLGAKLRIAIGASQQRLPLAYVEDVGQAIYLALKSDKAIGKAYNVVDDRIFQKEYLALLRRAKVTQAHTILLSPKPLYPLLSLVEGLCRLVRINPPVSRHQLERALASLRYDISCAREELGWSPRIGVAEGLMNIREAMRRGGNVAAAGKGRA